MALESNLAMIVDYIYKLRQIHLLSTHVGSQYIPLYLKLFQLYRKYKILYTERTLNPNLILETFKNIYLYLSMYH